MYRLVRDEQGHVLFDKKGGKKVPKFVELTEAEKLRLKPGKDGKVRIFNNGIFNDVDAAARHAYQMSDAAAGDVYFVYNPESDNALSELMIAGFQHFLEGSIYCRCFKRHGAER